MCFLMWDDQKIYAKNCFRRATRQRKINREKKNKTEILLGPENRTFFSVEVKGI